MKNGTLVRAGELAVGDRFMQVNGGGYPPGRVFIVYEIGSVVMFHVDGGRVGFGIEKDWVVEKLPQEEERTSYDHL